MCVQCMKERLPDRVRGWCKTTGCCSIPFPNLQGNTCLDGGTYLLNYAGCVQCQKKTLLEETNIQREEDEDGEETVTYKRWYTCRHGQSSHIGSSHIGVEILFNSPVYMLTWILVGIQSRLLELWLNPSWGIIYMELNPPG